MESTFIVNQRIGDSGGVLYTNRWTLDVAVAVAPPDAVPSPLSFSSVTRGGGGGDPERSPFTPRPPRDGVAVQRENPAGLCGLVKSIIDNLYF